jgi:DNA replication protein
MLEGRTTDELMRIAASGGGFFLKAGGRTTDDLMRIAAAASGKSARMTFSGLGGRTTEELMRIAACGKGCVEFAD